MPKQRMPREMVAVFLAQLQSLADGVGMGGEISVNREQADFMLEHSPALDISLVETDNEDDENTVMAYEDLDGNVVPIRDAGAGGCVVPCSLLKRFVAGAGHSSILPDEDEEVASPTRRRKPPKRAATTTT